MSFTRRRKKKKPNERDNILFPHCLQFLIWWCLFLVGGGALR